jgi:uracil-DNA glycosylase
VQRALFEEQKGHEGTEGGPAALKGRALGGGADTTADNRLREPLARQFNGVASAWQSVTEPFSRSAIGASLMARVDARVGGGATVYPATPFKALALTPPEQVRVVILGQDPYHGPGQAQGLAFSVAPGQRKLPPSLRNIVQEVAADTGAASQCRDDLSAWASQGVLLLNAVLTVEDGAPHSHAGWGWEGLTDALIAHVAARPEPVVFMLWGAAAQRKREVIELAAGNLRHAILLANHPSPLSARRGPLPFVGCRHFSQANALLAASRGAGSAIRW